MKNKHNFYIYPTLIDSFDWMTKTGTPDKFQELIDKINRKPIDMPDFVKKGSAFESCVNSHIDGNKIYEKDGFKFESNIIEKLARKLQNTIGKQKWIERTIPFKYGNVRIGGFLDFDFPDKIVDLKTTNNYKLGKYMDNNQHKAYGLIKPEKKSFVYLCSNFNDYFIEPYNNKKEYQDEFIYKSELFYEFVKDNEHLITDRKILNKI